MADALSTPRPLPFRVNRRAALSVGAANLIGRVSGLARDVTFAAFFGAGTISDAYNAAVRVPLLLRELVAEGSLQNVVVPAFAETTVREGAEAAWRLASAVLGALLLILGLATAAFWVGAELWVRLVADGFSADPAKLALATTLTRWLAPFLAGLSLAAFFGGLLNVRGRFFVPAMAQNVLNFGVIAACIGGDSFARVTGLPAIVAVAAATTVSGFVQLFMCVPSLWREGFRFRPTFGGHPALRKLLLFFGTAFIGVATVQFNVLVESQWASGMGEGVLTWLLGSFRLVQLPLALVAGTLVTALLPSLSGQLARGETAAAGESLNATLRTHAFLVLPAAVGLGVLAEPIVALIYERGAFDHADTVGTASMLQMYALATYGICLHRLLVPVFFASQRPRWPMVLSLATLAAKVPIVLLLTRGLGLGAPALPLSHAITVSAECVGLGYGLRVLLAGRGLGVYHLRLGVAASLMGVVAWALAPRLPVVLVVLLAGAVYLAVAAALGALSLPSWKKPVIPPFVEAETARWLDQIRAGAEGAGEGLIVGGERLGVHMVEGALVLRPEGSPLPRCPSREWEGSGAGLGIAPGPAPKLVMLEVAGRRWHVAADLLEAGAAVRIDLPPPSKT